MDHATKLYAAADAVAAAHDLRRTNLCGGGLLGWKVFGTDNAVEVYCGSVSRDGNYTPLPATEEYVKWALAFSALPTSAHWPPPAYGTYPAPH